MIVFCNSCLSLSKLDCLCALGTIGKVGVSGLQIIALIVQARVLLYAVGISFLVLSSESPMAISGAGKIVALLAGVDQNDGIGLVAVVDQVLAELEVMGMAWSQRIRPQQV